MSLIYSRNKKGPKTDPWGTPEFVVLEEEVKPSKTTFWDLSDR